MCSRYISVRPETKVIVSIERNGAKMDLPMVPKRTEITDQFGNKMQLGIIGIVASQETGNFRVQNFSLLGAIAEGANESWNVAKGTYDYLAGLFAGKLSADQLGGPIKVAQASGQVATLGYCSPDAFGRHTVGFDWPVEFIACSGT